MEIDHEFHVFDIGRRGDLGIGRVEQEDDGFAFKVRALGRLHRCATEPFRLLTQGFSPVNRIVRARRSGIAPLKPPCLRGKRVPQAVGCQAAGFFCRSPARALHIEPPVTSSGLAGRAANQGGTLAGTLVLEALSQVLECLEDDRRREQVVLDRMPSPEETGLPVRECGLGLAPWTVVPIMDERGLTAAAILEEPGNRAWAAPACRLDDDLRRQHVGEDCAAAGRRPRCRAHPRTPATTRP